MKRTLLTLFILTIFTNFSKAQVGRWFQERQRINQERIRRAELNDSLNRSVMIQQRQLLKANPGATLSRGASLMLGGIAVSGASLVIGNSLLNQKNMNKDGYTIILVGSIAGVVLEVAGLSTVIRAGKQFEVRFSSNN